MIVTTDFETFYDQDYSLSRLSEVDYILDPRFQPIMCSIKLGRRPGKVYIGRHAIQCALDAIDWSKAAFLSHNTRFDGAIALWHFNVRPRMYLCTLSMARATTHIAAGGSSLDKVSHYLGLPPKGHQVATYRGYRLEHFTEAQLADYASYCLNDDENCRMIFDRLRRVIPLSELELIDIIIRMYIEPQVRLSTDKLAAHLDYVHAERQKAFAAVAHIDRSVFSSNQKFTQLLRDLHVDIPMKPSPTTGEDIPALAKSDRGFKDLCDDMAQPPEVQAVLAARIGAKSTIEETRTATMLNLSQRRWGNDQGWAPIPLRYYGAHTGRPSGDGGFNFLNLKRGSPIRDAIEAPDDWRIVHRDSSQIEARMVAWMANCHSLLRAFEQGRDVYCEFASKVYGRTITKADKLERFAGGKTPILGLGYGMGPERFQHTLFIGNGGISVTIELKESQRVVYLYRRTYSEIPQLWAVCDAMLMRMVMMSDPKLLKVHAAESLDESIKTSGCRLPPYTDNALWLPNNMALQYLDLSTERGVTSTGSASFEITYNGGPGKGRQKLFGGKVTENISQANSRIVITDIAVQVKRETGWRPFLFTYDSLDYCVPRSEAAAFDVYLEQQFRRRPTWAPTLPLASEGGYGRTLMEAERGVNM